MTKDKEYWKRLKGGGGCQQAFTPNIPRGLVFLAKNTRGKAIGEDRKDQ